MAARAMERGGRQAVAWVPLRPCLYHQPVLLSLLASPPCMRLSGETGQRLLTPWRTLGKSLPALSLSVSICEMEAGGGGWPALPAPEFQVPGSGGDWLLGCPRMLSLGRPRPGATVGGCPWPSHRGRNTLVSPSSRPPVPTSAPHWPSEGPAKSCCRPGPPQGKCLSSPSQLWPRGRGHMAAHPSPPWVEDL